jgi:dipeptidase E
VPEPERHVVAMGGFQGDEKLRDYVLELTGASLPKVRFLGTATGDSALATTWFYEQWPAARCEPAHVELFGMPENVEERLLEAEVIVVSGGNTANMLAVWRVHGVEKTLREAWKRGIVLTGWSAGAMCWFEAGVTDSFGPELAPLDGCLAFFGGSMCPHYDGEERRRPVYHELVGGGRLPAGYAADDLVGLHFAGTELAEIVTAREDARAYHVEREGGRVRESPLDARLLA